MLQKDKQNVLIATIERRYRNKQESSSNQDNVPLQVYKTRAIPLRQQEVDDEESRDDNVCIGSILQRSATARRPTMEKPNITQSRSLRSTSGRNKTIRDEIVPPVPSSQEDEELRFAMQRVWAVLDADSNQTEVTFNN